MGARPSAFQFSAPGPLRLYTTKELLELPPPTWLIQDILPEGGLCGIYGPPESTKSFIAIDLALCVATGTPWHGHAVQQGFVLYVAAEGGPGIGKRVRAWLMDRNIEGTEHEMGWLIESLSVYKDSTDLDTLMRRLDENEGVGRAPSLIVIDTLARCFDGDENQQEDMGRFVGGLDHLRHEYAATILAVHHTRLDGDRERGNTAFRGGTDTMIAVSRDAKSGQVSFECSKQKDSEHFEPIGFRLKPVPQVDSCVMVCTDNEKELKLQQMLSFLDDGPLSWEDWLGSTQIPKTTFNRYLVVLGRSGKIIKENGVYRQI